MKRTVAADPGAADLLLGLRAQGMHVRRGIDPARPADLWALAGPDAPVRLADLRARGGTVPALIIDAPAPGGRAALEPMARLLDPTLAAFRDAVGRASGTPTPGLLRVAGGVADLVRCRFWRNGQLAPLEPEEADLLAYLAARAGRVISRAELQVEVWGLPRPKASTREVDTAVLHLREHLGADGPVRDAPGGFRLDALSAPAELDPTALAARLDALGGPGAIELLADIEPHLDRLGRVGTSTLRGADAALCQAHWHLARGSRSAAIDALDRASLAPCDADRRLRIDLGRMRLGEDAQAEPDELAAASDELRARWELARAEVDLAGPEATSALKAANRAAGKTPLAARVKATDKARIGLARPSGAPKALELLDAAGTALAREDRLHDAIAVGLLAIRLDPQRAMDRSDALDELEGRAPDRRLAAAIAWTAATGAASAAARVDALDRYHTHLPESEWSPESRLLRARSLLALGRHGEAADSLVHGRGRLDRPESVRLQVLIALDQGRPRHAQQLLDEAGPTVHLPDERARLRFLEGATRHLLGDSAAAREAYGSEPTDGELAGVGPALRWLADGARPALPEGTEVPADLLHAARGRDLRVLDAASRDLSRSVPVRIWARIALVTAGRSRA